MDGVSSSILSPSSVSSDAMNLTQINQAIRSVRGLRAYGTGITEAQMKRLHKICQKFVATGKGSTKGERQKLSVLKSELTKALTRIVSYKPPIKFSKTKQAASDQLKQDYNSHFRPKKVAKRKPSSSVKKRKVKKKMTPLDVHLRTIVEVKPKVVSPIVKSKEEGAKKDIVEPMSSDSLAESLPISSSIGAVSTPSVVTDLLSMDSLPSSASLSSPKPKLESLSVHG